LRLPHADHEEAAPSDSEDGIFCRSQDCGEAGERTAISGPEAKARVHLLRAQCDAILVGMGTVLADDPELTCRLPGLEHRSPRPSC
jgi:hypothetical protein